LLQRNRQNTANAHYLYTHVQRLKSFCAENQLAPDYQQRLDSAISQSLSIDYSKIQFLESIQCLLLFAEKNFHDLESSDRRIEIQKIF